MAGLSLGAWVLLALVAVTAYLLGRRAGARRLDDDPLPPVAPRSPAAPANAEFVEPVLRPDRAMLGRYRLERQIGRGSMGAVYLGHDPQIGRAVAIKTMALSREFEGHELAEARARFFREAEMAGRHT